MAYLTKKDANKLIKKLSKSSDKEIQDIIKKLKFPEKRKVYVTDKVEIRRLIRKAFKEKRQVKIRYYSPHSDESATRIIDIYQIHNDCVTTFCHLRDEERLFRIDRIGSAMIMDKRYKIPKNWEPESIILNK